MASPPVIELPESHGLPLRIRINLGPVPRRRQHRRAQQCPWRQDQRGPAGHELAKQQSSSPLLLRGDLSRLAGLCPALPVHRPSPGPARARPQVYEVHLAEPLGHSAQRSPWSRARRARAGSCTGRGGADPPVRPSVRRAARVGAWRGRIRPVAELIIRRTANHPPTRSTHRRRGRACPPRAAPPSRPSADLAGTTTGPEPGFRRRQPPLHRWAGTPGPQPRQEPPRGRTILAQDRRSDSQSGQSQV